MYHVTMVTKILCFEISVLVVAVNTKLKNNKPEMKIKDPYRNKSASIIWLKNIQFVSKSSIGEIDLVQPQIWSTYMHYSKVIH